MINPFFKNSGPFKINDILSLLIELNTEIIIQIQSVSYDIKDLITVLINELLFFIQKNM